VFGQVVIDQRYRMIELILVRVQPVHGACGERGKPLFPYRSCPILLPSSRGPNVTVTASGRLAPTTAGMSGNETGPHKWADRFQRFFNLTDAPTRIADVDIDNYQLHYSIAK